MTTESCFSQLFSECEMYAQLKHSNQTSVIHFIAYSNRNFNTRYIFVMFGTLCNPKSCLIQRNFCLPFIVCQIRQVLLNVSLSMRSRIVYLLMQIESAELLMQIESLKCFYCNSNSIFATVITELFASTE